MPRFSRGPTQELLLDDRPVFGFVPPGADTQRVRLAWARLAAEELDSAVGRDGVYAFRRAPAFGTLRDAVAIFLAAGGTVEVVEHHGDMGAALDAASGYELVTVVLVPGPFCAMRSLSDAPKMPAEGRMARALQPVEHDDDDGAES